MGKTVFITGSSTGIGRATALLFQMKGWNVAATMRHPEKEQELDKLQNVITPKVDVTDITSIKDGIQETIDKFGQIDVIVNNAGYGLVGALENISLEEINKQFDVNLFGPIKVIKEILPYFREKKMGTIVNVSSMGGRITFPFFSVYHSTKWALEGLSESLWFELKSLNIKVKLIEPGAINTDFYGRSAKIIENSDKAEYEHGDKMLKSMRTTGKFGVSPNLVAKVIFRAAKSNSFRLRYTAFGGSWLLLALRKILPGEIFRWAISLFVS